MWNADVHGAFDYFVSILSDKCFLYVPQVSDTFKLQTDVSRLDVRAVLSIVRDNVEKPVGYFSRRLTKADKNYSATGLECLAVVKAIDHFAVHLIGTQFVVQTDHKALEALWSSTHLNGRLTRWALALQSYIFSMQYGPGKLNQNADGLFARPGRT